MSKLVQEIFGINILVMRIFGYYPPQKYSRLYKLYSICVYCFFTTLTPVLSSLYLFLDPEINLDKIADGAFVICQLGCFTFKILPFLVNSNKVKESIHMIEHPVFTTYTKSQGKIVENCVKVCKRTNWFFFNFCVACVVTWCITPFFEKEYKLPINVWLPYDFSASLKLYVVSFVYVTAGTGSGAILNGAVDPLIAGLAYCATSQIKILKDNLQNLNKHAEEMMKREQVGKCDELKHKIIYDRIKYCAEHHNIIIRFVEIYETIFSATVFSQFSGSVLVICICCLKLSQTNTLSVSLIFIIVFFITMLSEIFLYCYFGATLFEESDKIVQAIYMGKWYEYDLKSQKALLNIMERSKKPIVVTAGMILDLSLGTFTMILKRAYSLLAVLKNY